MDRQGLRALAVARALKAGTIWQNTYNQFDPTSPFGGYKESGFGREGGAAGLRPYVRVCVSGAPSPRPTSSTWAARSRAASPAATWRPPTTGQPRANVPRGTRKDVRDAVRAARGALPGWQGRTAYNRGQILYRFAEALESRADELTRETARLRGMSAPAARAEIEAAVDTAVHYAGWTDKLHAVLGAVNPVAAPHFGFTFPEPTGVVGVIAPEEPDVLGLVAEILPPLAAGNVVVAVVSERWPLLSLHLGEVLGVADVPPAW